MITAVHIEDEINNQILLESLLKKHFADSITLTGNATTVEDGIKLIQTRKPQLVFLDIELKKGDALNLPIEDESIDIAAQNCLFNIFKAEDLKKVRKEIDYFYEDLEEIIKEKNFKKE